MAFKRTVTAILAAITLTVLPANAKGPGGPGGHGDRKGRMMEMMKDLNLTPEQQKKMKEVNEQKHAVMQEKRKAMQAAREDLHNTLKGTASDDEAKKKFEVLEKAQDEFARARFDHVLAVRGILTPEQRTKFHDKMKDKMGRHGRGMHGEDDGED
jgi:periplasmic protein CpxP/Spy